MSTPIMPADPGWIGVLTLVLAVIQMIMLGWLVHAVLSGRKGRPLQ